MTYEDAQEKLEMDIQKILHRELPMFFDRNDIETTDVFCDDITEQIMHFVRSYFTPSFTHAEDQGR